MPALVSALRITGENDDSCDRKNRDPWNGRLHLLCGDSTVVTDVEPFSGSGTDAIN
jgi:hypothetical protein